MNTPPKKKLIIALVVISICVLTTIVAIMGLSRYTRKLNNKDGEATQTEYASETSTATTEEIDSAETENSMQNETETVTESESTEELKPEETESETTESEAAGTEEAKPNEENPDAKVIYLTFDDGPGPYTERLLDVLDEYGVKVTFFVTNCHPQYQHMIGEAYRRGHTIALHTYNHHYSNYSSEELYYQDLKLINDIVVAQTGIQPTIIRFPGGSSNTKSKEYCEGIMTTLTQSIASHGYKYCDWNVSSGDGNSSISTEAVIDNVINGVSKRDVSVVLQHDPVSSSVEAVDDIIRWGLENGYTFKPMTDESPMIHHTVAN